VPTLRNVAWKDLADLEFDHSNPRHEPGMTRREIISYLVGNESVLGLARDIADVGLSPLDRFGAVESPDGGYIVMEGNRRLCALVLLHDPSLAPPKERKSFERIAKGLKTDTLFIELAVFSDPTEANLWIERKHSGQAGGIGPRPWTATQQARHYGNALALRLIEYAVTKKMVSKKDAAGVITTVTRFVSTPYVRQHGLGITTSAAEPDFAIQGTQALFELRLERLMQDIVARANGATSRTNSGDRTKYATDHLVPIIEVEAAGSKPSDKSSATQAGSEAHGPQEQEDRAAGATSASGSEKSKTLDTPSGDGATSSSSSSEQKADKSPHPNERKLLVPATFAPSFRSERLKRIASELKAVQKQTPIAAALLVRVFVEAVTISYLESRGVELGHNDKLHSIVHNVVKRIEDDRSHSSSRLTKQEIGALLNLKNQVTQPHYVYSAAYLGLVAHGSAFPEWSTLTSKWDEIESILSYIATHAEQPIQPLDA
jgi:hypothetical protein